MPVVDLSKFEELATLEFSVTTPQGERQVWQIPPFMGDTELAIRGLMSRSRKKDDDATPSLSGAYWAPIIAKAVKSPVLDADQLASDYSGAFLRTVGVSILSFFLSGSLPSEVLGAIVTTPENPEN